MGLRNEFEQLDDKAEGKWGGVSVLVLVGVGMVIGFALGVLLV